MGLIMVIILIVLPRTEGVSAVTQLTRQRQEMEPRIVCLCRGASVPLSYRMNQVEWPPLGVREELKLFLVRGQYSSLDYEDYGLSMPNNGTRVDSVARA